MEYQTFSELLDVLKNEGLIYNDADFCRKTGLKPSFVSEMRAGKKPFTGLTRKKIEETFPDFFNVKIDAPAPDVAHLLTIMEGDRELIREMARRKDEEIDRLLSIVEAVTGAQKKATPAAS